MPGGNCFAAIDEESAELGLGGGRHDGLDDLGNRKHGAVIGLVGGIIRHEKMSAGAAAGI